MSNLMIKATEFEFLELESLHDHDKSLAEKPLRNHGSKLMSQINRKTFFRNLYVKGGPIISEKFQ